jgi:CheY-like chemotaxis protein
VRCEDGYWLVREVARTLNTRDAPAVAVTAFAGQHPRSKALAAGFRAHLAKPVDPDVLCRTVAQVMAAE